MNCIDVSTQAELDTALAAHPDACIHIKGEGEFILAGSASVTASGSASVTASGSASVRASGSASVTASGSASVRAFDTASVTASGSASVTASGSASVTASGSASVTASGSASVTASGSASVTASQYVAVHKLSSRVRISGAGHVIEPPDLTGADATTWLSYHGIEPDENGVVTLYKAVDDKFTTGRGFDYSPGATPEAPDWRADASCGGGLHFGPTPVHAMAYHTDATRFLACPVRVDEIAVIDQQKVKARRVVEPGCREVDIDGEPVAEKVLLNQR